MEKLTEKQLVKKLKSLPEPLEGKQDVFLPGPHEYPEQEIYCRLLNLKGYLVEQGIETYSKNILPPKQIEVLKHCKDYETQNCVDFVTKCYDHLAVPNIEYYNSLFGKRMPKKLKKKMNSHFKANHEKTENLYAHISHVEDQNRMHSSL